MQNSRRPLVLSTLLAIGLCFAYLFSTNGHESRDADRSLHSTEATPSEGLAELEQTENPMGPGRTAIEELTPDPQPEPNPNTILLRGRCILGGSQQPLAQCSAQTKREPSSAGASNPESDPTSSAITGADGVFELEVPILSDHEDVVLQLARTGFVTREARWKRPKTGAEFDVGDIEIDRAIQVTGKVTFPDGEPVIDARILFANVALTGQAKVEPARMLRTRTDAIGGFQLEEPAFFGEWYPRVEGSGALLEPQMVVLTEEDHPDYRIHLIVERPDPKVSITGMCVDESGRAMSQVHVSAAGDGFRGQGWSREDGTVTIPRAGPTPQVGKVSLWASDEDLEYEQVLPAPKADHKWGDRNVRFVLRRLATQHVQVVDERGEPVSKFSLFAFSNRDDRPSRYRHLSMHGQHADGRVKLTRLKNGDNSLLVVPKATGLGPTSMVPFTADSSIPPQGLTVTVPDLATLDVQVRDASGAPVAGSRVELLQSIIGVAPKVTSDVVDVADCDQSQYSPYFARQTEAQCDTAGTAHLLVSPGTWFLRVSGASHMRLIQEVQVSKGHTSIPVTVQAGGSLSGKVSPLAAIKTLQLLSPGDSKPVSVELREKIYTDPVIASIQPDGTYSVAGVTPGKYKVSLRYWMKTSTVTDGWIKVPIADMELESGQHKELMIDAKACLPGQVSGHFYVDGKPLKDKHCFVKRRDPSPNIMLRIATDSEGHFEASIPPGTYSYSITLEAIPGPGWVMMTIPGEWPLEAGGTRKTTHNIELRTVRVQVLDESGKALANQDMNTVAPDFHRPGPMRTDDSGWVTVSPAPLSAFHLVTTIGEVKHKLGPIDLPPGQTNGDVTIRVGEDGD